MRFRVFFDDVLLEYILLLLSAIRAGGVGPILTLLERFMWRLDECTSSHCCFMGIVDFCSDILVWSLHWQPKVSSSGDCLYFGLHILFFEYIRVNLHALRIGDHEGPSSSKR